MSLLQIVVTTVSCLFIQEPIASCVPRSLDISPTVAGIQAPAPEFTGESLDVVLTAEAALVWDMASGEVLYAKRADVQRPVASLSKLLSVLSIRSLLTPDTIVEIPEDVRRAQRMGANIKLPVGEHASVRELLEAGLIASANDAMVALAVASRGSEEEFVSYANEHAKTLGVAHTQIANATGLTGGTQFSTAHDIRTLLETVYADPVLAPFLSQKGGVLTTQEESTRAYETTNDLLGTYLPILAAKTGYTLEAGESLAVITEGEQGQKIGVVVLGSTQRFQDAKVLVGWIWRNYTWPHSGQTPDI